MKLMKEDIKYNKKEIQYLFIIITNIQKYNNIIVYCYLFVFISNLLLTFLDIYYSNKLLSSCLLSTIVKFCFG